ncbi:thioredoxin [Fimbriimonas ginsengisoli Gsoil 348]|uniref:Thioredoxin n=1 Tax=Fimbriimonas ginsengisoli Gsoil 348 TaxID=661478 RepID=A0A068NKE1_FIMGI|nr:thioredoxin [Fimbriimonas ginsengisoli Gsoil 348]
MIEVKQSEFDQKALQAEGLVLVDFSAPWCGPCRRMEPELEAAAQEFAGKATFLKVNVDESPDVAMRYGVQGIPNLTFLKDGKVVDTVIGAMPKAAIVSRLKKNL